MPYSEDELISISALQHLLFCERQCALIHIEQLWSENQLTAEGRILHERAHEAGVVTRGSVRAVRGLRVRSLEHGVVGIADVVEFHAPEGHVAKEMSLGCFWEAPENIRAWKVVPIEYKRGRKKKERYDEVQLCAQALCLEEMLCIGIESGALFYGQQQARVVVSFDSVLREKTINACRRLHEVLAGKTTPPAVYKSHCNQCSLVEECMPTITGGKCNVRTYFQRALEDNARGI